MTKYVKIKENGDVLEYAPRDIPGISNWGLDEANVLAAGFLPLEETPQPRDGNPRAVLKYCGGAMFKNILVIGSWVASIVLAYQLGTSRAEVQYIEKKVEVVKYEKGKACNLLAKPNLGDDDISRLFDNGQL